MLFNNQTVIRIENLRKRYPNYIFLFKVDSMLLAFGDDAHTLGKICGAQVNRNKDLHSIFEFSAKMNASSFEKICEALTNAGHAVAVANDQLAQTTAKLN